MTKALPLFYHEFGQGNPPLLILHGFLGMSDNWIPIGRRLSSDYLVIIPDLRNHGRSPHSSHFDFEEMETDIIELLDVKGISVVNLLGHSMGGRLAMRLATDFPDRIRRCEVVDISPFSLPADNESLFMLQMMQQTMLKEYNSFSEIKAVLKTKLFKDELVQFCSKNIMKTGNAGYRWKPNLDVLMAEAWKLRQSISLQKTFKGEVLFIIGKKSPYFNCEEWPEILKLFPHADFRIIKEAGHWVHVDAPEMFYEETYHFFTEKT